MDRGRCLSKTTGDWSPVPRVREVDDVGVRGSREHSGDDWVV